MKKKILVLVLVVTAVFMFTGCEEFINMILGGGITTVVDRIQQFEDDLNASSRSYTDLNDNFSSSTTQFGQTSGDADYWDNAFPPEYNYEFSTIIVSGNSATAVLDVTSGDAVLFSDVSVSFSMTEDSDGFLYILTFSGFDLRYISIAPAP